MIKVRKLFEFDDRIEIPEPKQKYCSDRIITMDFINGFPVTSEKIKDYKLSKKEIIQVLNNCYFA